jgi:hypothetical protein
MVQFLSDPHCLITGSGVDESSSQTGIHVFPNPAENFVQVNIENNEQGARISMYDAAGKIVHTCTQTGTTTTINLHAYAQGLYLMHVQTSNAQQLFRVVKE